MLVKDWMTTDPITVTPDTSVMKASQIMKENNVRRLPVIKDDGSVLGIVTDRDLKEASPSKATTLDVHSCITCLASSRSRTS
jgi:acetoin utilization protein AcuB